MGHISTSTNNIIFEGDFGEVDLRIALASFHNLTTKSGYQDIIVDFSNITKVLAPEFLPFCAFVRKQLHDGIDTTYIPPQDNRLARLFQNTNWAYLLDPRGNEKAEVIARAHLPALLYSSGEDQHQAVENTVQILLTSLKDLTRGQLAALEWSINEITDNVLNHSESAIGGIMQVTSRRDGRFIEFVVCDAGVGIPHTLRSAHTNINSDAEALDQAIREGITRNRSTNMGNGLYGSYRISQLSGGSFGIYSGFARLKFDKKNGMHVSTEKVPFKGTLVSCTIDCTNPSILEDALVFRGKKYTPTYTYFDRADEEDKIVLLVSEEATSFGSREASKPIRTKIENILHNSDASIEIDMSGVELISSSFADEIFGKVFSDIGPLSFMQRIKISNMNKLVSQLVDRAISQRMSMT